MGEERIGCRARKQAAEERTLSVWDSIAVGAEEGGPVKPAISTSGGRVDWTDLTHASVMLWVAFGLTRRMRIGGVGGVDGERVDAGIEVA